MDSSVKGFRVVEDNVIAFREGRLIDPDDVQTCDCRKDHAEGDICAGEECTNRATRTECLIGFCSKARCRNMRLQRKVRADVRVVDAGVKGRGLVSESPIKAGDIISEYTGEVIPEAEYERRMQIYAAAGSHFYMMGLGRHEYLDAARCGNHMRYMNHSCEANA